tara:strand:- start:2554 stop:3171 length:618 start_codon:yes stop_codon:yes gene_type:complete
MKIELLNKNTLFPILISDNWYSKEEEKNVWREINYLHSLNEYEKSEESSACDENNKSKSKGNRLYYDLIFREKKYSHICKMLYKIQDKSFHNLIEKSMPIGKIFKDTDWDNTLLNYYEDSDNYKSHYDYSLFTMLIFFNKEPKLFSGGDLYFKESDTTIEFKHNRMILFPGHYLHQANKVSMNSKYQDKMNGRFTITHFISKNPV